MSLCLDAHVHLWRIDRGDYGWIEPGSLLHRDFALDDLRRQARGMDGVVLVQAAPTEAETAFLLREAEASAGLVKAVVGWSDLAAKDAPERIEALARHPLLRGLRPMLQDLPEPDWILRRDLAPALAAMQEAGLALDLLVKPRQLPGIRRFAARHPDLPMVLDHCGKPDIKNRQWQGWADDIARIASETGIFCKLSGLVTEAGLSVSPADLRPYVDHVIACFGTERVIWGSDWPVVTLAASHDQWRRAAHELTGQIAAPDREAIYGANAARFYRLEVPKKPIAKADTGA